MERGRQHDLTLAIATGHDLSVALIAGSSIVASIEQSMERGHAESLMPAIERLFADWASDARPAQILVETGPGSFTGLRIGIAAAQALGLAWSCSVKGVRSTLLVAAFARSSGIEGPLMVGLAAPRGQVWVESFGPGGLQSVAPPVALSRADAERLASDMPVVAGTAGLADAAGHVAEEIRPLAAYSALVAPALHEPPQPHYVRIADAA